MIWALTVPHIPPTREWSDLLQYVYTIDGHGQLLLEILWWIKNSVMFCSGVLLALVFAVTWRG